MRVKAGSTEVRRQEAWLAGRRRLTGGLGGGGQRLVGQGASGLEVGGRLLYY